MKRGALFLVALLAGAVLPVAAPAVTACAAEEGPRAALVVDTGETVYRYCVALPDESVSGIDLIVAAGEQHGLTYRFGYGGNAVCMLADVGTTGDDCFEDYPNFWGYWRGDGDGGWTWSSSGAHATTVEDGGVEGWSWGPGDGPSSHQSPPATTYPSVCPVAASPGDGGGDTGPRSGRHPKPQPPSGGTGTPPPTTDAGTSEPGPDPQDGAGRLGAREKKKKAAADRRSEKSPTRVGRRHPRSDDSKRSGGTERAGADKTGSTAAAETRGIPGGALLSLGVVGFFGLGGVVIARRRKVA